MNEHICYFCGKTGTAPEVIESETASWNGSTMYIYECKDLKACEARTAAKKVEGV